jgi:hypothetical protein
MHQVPREHDKFSLTEHHLHNPPVISAIGNLGFIVDTLERFRLHDGAVALGTLLNDDVEPSYTGDAQDYAHLFGERGVLMNCLISLSSVLPEEGLTNRQVVIVLNG